MANLSSFNLTVNLSGSVANPINSNTYQIVTPWGATDVCYSWQQCLNQLCGKGGSIHSGRMGQFWNAQITNGLTTSSQTAPVSANLFSTTP